jgi:hypothetical protein
MSSQPNEQTIVLKEILKWVKFAGLKEVKGILTSTTNNDPKRLIVYYLSDGNHGSKEIAAIAGASNVTVLNLWELWLKMGLGDNIPVKGGLRFKRSFDLQELGIEVPDIKESEGKKQEASLEQLPNGAQGMENQDV